MFLWYFLQTWTVLTYSYKHIFFFLARKQINVPKKMLSGDFLGS